MCKHNYSDSTDKHTYIRTQRQTDREIDRQRDKEQSNFWKMMFYGCVRQWEVKNKAISFYCPYRQFTRKVTIHIATCTKKWHFHLIMHTFFNRIDRFVYIPPDPKLLERKLKMKFYIEEDWKDMYFEGQICSYDGQTGKYGSSFLLMV